MNYKELTELMKAAGWQFDRQAKGSHEIWKKPGQPGQITVPNHGSKEIKPRLVKGIKNQAGIK